MTNLQKIEKLKEVKSGLEILLSHARDLYEEILTKVDVGFGVAAKAAEAGVDNLVGDLEDLIFEVNHDILALEGS